MLSSTLFLIVLSVIAAVALAGFQYFYRTNSRGKYRWLLASLRAIGIFCVLLLLINPKIVTTQYSTVKPNLVLAIDNSSSISNFGSAAEVVNFVEDIRTDPRIQNRFDIHTYSFGRDLSEADSLSFSESHTNIQGALKSLNSLFKDAPSPTLLITDGNETLGQNFQFEAQNFTNPLFPVVVGDTTPNQDLSVTRVNVNKYAFLNNQFPVEVIIKYSGDEPVDSELQILNRDRVIYSNEVSLDDLNNSQVLEIYLQASAIGNSIYKAHLVPLEGEKNIYNNTQSFSVEVIDERSRILLLTDLVHPDIGAIKRSIETNQQREVEVRNIADTPSDLDQFELIILYQPTNKFREVWDRIGPGNLNHWVITGPETDWRFLNQVQEHFQKEITQQTEEYFPVLNKKYASFQIEEIGFKGFPPLIEDFGEIESGSQSQSLLFQQVQGLERNTPLLATVEEGNSKAGFLFGANIWQWRSHVYSEGGSFEPFDNFVGSLVQYLSSNQRKERLSISHENFFYGNEEIIISAQYFDKNYGFDPRADLSLEFWKAGSGEKQRVPLNLSGNNYVVELNNLTPGEYNFEVTVEGEGHSRSGRFSVADFEIEKQFTNANLPGLQQIAYDQQTETFFLDDSEEIIEKLLSDNTYATVQKSHKNHVSLVDWYYLLAIVVLSLSAEWFLRKYHGLI